MGLGSMGRVYIQRQQEMHKLLKERRSHSWTVGSVLRPSTLRRSSSNKTDKIQNIIMLTLYICNSKCSSNYPVNCDPNLVSLRPQRNADKPLHQTLVGHRYPGGHYIISHFILSTSKRANGCGPARSRACRRLTIGGCIQHSETTAHSSYSSHHNAR